MYHARNMLIPLVLRQSTAVLRRTHYPTSLRQFSVTPPPQAAENEDSFISKFKNTSVFQQLADKPDALAAIQKFAQLLQSSGIEMGTGMPSKMQMLRLAANAEFRSAAQNVVTELKSAGVDLNSAEAMQEIMNIQKGGSGQER